jgi:hypothetical protein
VKSGDRLQGMDIALLSAAAIEGRVTDQNGEPLSQMSSSLPGSRPGATFRSASRTRWR